MRQHGSVQKTLIKVLSCTSRTPGSPATREQSCAWICRLAESHCRNPGTLLMWLCWLQGLSSTSWVGRWSWHRELHTTALHCVMLACLLLPYLFHVRVSSFIKMSRLSRACLCSAASGIIQYIISMVAPWVDGNSVISIQSLGVCSIRCHLSSAGSERCCTLQTSEENPAPL